MRFKLDENFGRRTSNLFLESGHEVETVRQEGLNGSSDLTLFDACKRESKCLVSLDLDFADVTRFPPHLSAGIAVFRPPKNPTLPLLERLVSDFLGAVNLEGLQGRLWIIEPGRIRIHEGSGDSR